MQEKDLHSTILMFLVWSTKLLNVALISEKKAMHIVLIYDIWCCQAAELRDSIGDDHLAWVAQYMVMKRASIEPNFHSLYAQFIGHLQQAKMLNMVVRETFRNIKVNYNWQIFLFERKKGEKNKW